jgi:hypothetical protein
VRCRENKCEGTWHVSLGEREMVKRLNEERERHIKCRGIICGPFGVPFCVKGAFKGYTYCYFDHAPLNLIRVVKNKFLSVTMGLNTHGLV